MPNRYRRISLFYSIREYVSVCVCGCRFWVKFCTCGFETQFNSVSFFAGFAFWNVLCAFCLPFVLFLLRIDMNKPNLCKESTTCMFGSRFDMKNWEEEREKKKTDMKNGQLIHGIFAVVLSLCERDEIVRLPVSPDRIFDVMHRCTNTFIYTLHTERQRVSISLPSCWLRRKDIC